jgi:hypothetical protein
MGEVKDGELTIVIGGVGFLFWRLSPDEWTGGLATTIAQGYAIDEPWLTAARSVAAEKLRGLLGDEPAETLRCPDCARLLMSPTLVRLAKVRLVICGPRHVIVFDDGFEVEI